MLSVSGALLQRPLLPAFMDAVARQRGASMRTHIGNWCGNIGKKN